MPRRGSRSRQSGTGSGSCGRDPLNARTRALGIARPAAGFNRSPPGGPRGSSSDEGGTGPWTATAGGFGRVARTAPRDQPGPCLQDRAPPFASAPPAPLYRAVASGRGPLGWRATPAWRRWRDGRVAEGARLESVYTGNRIVGSNPTPSAIRPPTALDYDGRRLLNQSFPFAHYPRLQR